MDSSSRWRSASGAAGISAAGRVAFPAAVPAAAGLTPESAPAADGSWLIHGGGPLLLQSLRRVANLVAYSITYEFEDVIAEVTGADRVNVAQLGRLEFSRRTYKLLRHASGSMRLARTCAPPVSTVSLQRDYALFFPTFNHAYELYALAATPGWRRRCGKAACFIMELWPHQIPRYLLELLRDFDHIFLGVQSPVAEVASITGRPCSYLPPAADVLRFSPCPDMPARIIDVCNLGRRSDATHQALVRLAQQRQLFYYHDTVAASGIDNKQRTFEVQDASEHRLLLASLLRHSRYFIANRARANDPQFTAGCQEIASRYYEGCAAGTVMLGEPPASPVFERLFGWPDAVIHLPFDAPHVGAVLAGLERDPQRLQRISLRNAREAALRHDWLHRLQTVFDTLGLVRTPGMAARERRLQALARQVTKDGDCS